MRTLREWIRRLRGTLRRGRSNADLEQELRAHLELAAEDSRRRGLRPEQAIRTARIKAGGTAQALEALRDQRGLPWLDDLARDVGHGLRMLRRSPGFAAVSLVTLALGIGANTAIFTIVNGVILRPLGYPGPEQLIYLTARFPALGASTVCRRWSTSNSRSSLDRFPRSAHSPSARSISPRATGRGACGRQRWTNICSTCSASKPLRGGSSPEARRPRPVGYPPSIAILSYDLWQTALGGQPIAGRTVEADGRLHDVIGVMPPGADVMDTRPEIWLPLGHPPDRLYRVGDHFLYVIGRLRQGVTPQSAQTELDHLLDNWGPRAGPGGAGVAGHVPRHRPPGAAGHNIQMRRLRDVVLGDAGRSIWMLQAAVGIVLLIAGANLASLLMARAETRRREFAVRTALGASRGRLLRQAMTEGLLLSIGGGLVGLWLARLGVDAIIRAYPNSLPRTGDVAVDVPVLLFALAVSTATGLLFGLAPVAHTGVRRIGTALKESGGRGSIGAARHHLRRALVIAEVALAVVLVIGAGLLARTVYNLAAVDAGFDRSRLVTFSMTLPVATSNAASRALTYQRLLDKLRAAPGVQAATAMSGLPPNRAADMTGTFVEHYISPTGESFEVVDYYQHVMSDYFETMGIPVVAGRGFERADAGAPGGVVLVNQTLSNRLWKGQNPIGRHLSPCCGKQVPMHTVIGVARDVRQRGVAREAGPELYLFIEERAIAPPTMNVVLRTTLPAAALSQTVERMVREVDPAVPVVRLRDMEAVFAESMRRPRLLGQLLGAFAGVALLLAAVGTYGVLSYMVAERRREIGIRMALGAERSNVLAHVMKQGLQLTTAGMIAGLAGALALNRMMASLLYGVQPTDPATLAAVTATIALVAAVACWLPAFRASRLDPIVVLRGD